MIGWIILAAYIVGWIVFVPVIARFMADPIDDAVDRVLTIILGMTFALFWPLVIPGAWFYKQVFKRGETK